MSTATAISAFSFYLQSSELGRVSIPDDRYNQIFCQLEQGTAWLMTQQNLDGGFGDTPLNSSNISTTMLVVAALNAIDSVAVDCQFGDRYRQSTWDSQIQTAQRYIDAAGGVAGLRKRYGKDKTFAVPILANCAMAGIVPWSEVSALPFEAAVVPQRFYNWLQLPVVSYAVPALVAIGLVKFKLDPPWDPFRKTLRAAAVGRSLKVLENIQPASGGFLEAIPLTSFVVMGLVEAGFADHQVVQQGVKFLVESFVVEGVFDNEIFDSSGRARAVRSLAKFETEKETGRLAPFRRNFPARLEDGEDTAAGSLSHGRHSQGGSWPIDTNLATWNTTLSINALASCPQEFQKAIADDPIRWRNCLNWILSCQNKTVHPFTGAAAGGWGWSDLSGAVPDADDTPGALLALKNFYLWGDVDELQKQQILESARLGIDWLLKLQNRDRGWPTFCRGWTKLPFDRSGPDITAHVIRGLVAWQQDLPRPEIDTAVNKGFKFLERQQRVDGSWLPLWFGNQHQPDDENPYYGTAKVLLAYRDTNSLDTKPASDGLRWLVDHQNSDGGWGGKGKLKEGEVSSPVQQAGPASSGMRVGVQPLGALERAKREAYDSSLSSSVEETALCTETLLAHHDPSSRLAAQQGVQWLRLAVEQKRIADFSPIGFYFAKLWYFEELYPLIFATSALGVAGQQVTDLGRHQKV